MFEILQKALGDVWNSSKRLRVMFGILQKALDDVCNSSEGFG